MRYEIDLKDIEDFINYYKSEFDINLHFHLDEIIYFVDNNRIDSATKEISKDKTINN